MITMADLWREEGIEKGMERGIQQEKIKTVHKMLSLQLDPQLIAEITHLSIQQIVAESEKIKDSAH